MFNIIGELLFSNEIRNSNSATIDISNLQSNLYLLQVELIEETIVMKIMKTTPHKK